MKVSFRRGLSIALVAAAAAGVVVAVWAWRTSEPAQPVTATAIAATPGGSPVHTRSATHPPMFAGTTPPDVDPYGENPLGDVMHRVVDNDQQLHAFKAFYDRPLLDDDSLKQYHALLSDPATLAAVEHDLLYPEEAKADQASSIKRLMKIDYLHEALDWKDNPQHAVVVGVVSNVILTDNYPPDMGMDMRVSLSGNKQELFQLLDEYEPAKAKALLQASKGTRLEPMVAWIATSNETRKQLESKLENQVTP
jgi:hypothetical protein